MNISFVISILTLLGCLFALVSVFVGNYRDPDWTRKNASWLFLLGCLILGVQLVGFVRLLTH